MSNSSSVDSPDSQSRCTTAASTGDEAEERKTFTRDESLLLFDWDDTILPSSWLGGHRMTLDAASYVPCDMRRALDKLAVHAREMLALAAENGTVVLVTNAEEGWIDLSCKKFLPTLAPFLSNIRQLSARSKFESPRFTNPCVWKQLAFREEILRFYGKKSRYTTKNILSFGDSAHERLALLVTTSASLVPCSPRKLDPSARSL
eukprot:Lankesteria_metandrocarpae@DN5450_c0_g1_i4.p1